MKIITYEEIKNIIEDYWVKSDIIRNIIDNITFDDLLINEKIKNGVIKDIVGLLETQYKNTLYIENMTPEELFNVITKNKLKYISDNFVKYVKDVVKDKFDGRHEMVCLYIDYSYHIQKLTKVCEEYNESKTKKNFIEYIRQDDGIIDVDDYLSQFNIDLEELALYNKEIVSQVINEYTKGASYRELVKKYHPDARKYLDEEYIKIINYLKREKIIK